MIELNTVAGVHRIQNSYTNWYLLEENHKLTVVDCGIRSTSWKSLADAVARIGRSLSDIEAVILTHAHFDHVGFAERARTELGVPVLVHEEEVPLVRDPKSFKSEGSKLPYLFRPKAMPILGGFYLRRAFSPEPIKKVETFTDGVLPVPGSPEVVFTPGHTFGHCAFHLADRDAVFTGDAIVMINPFTGKSGPQIVARPATADSKKNLETIGAIAATGATNVLTGHGPVWRKGAAEAVRLTREAGPS